MILFFIKFFLTNIVFSFLLCSSSMRMNKNGRFSGAELMLYFLGLGPVFTSLILYYSLLLFPHHTNLFYLTLIFSVYILIAIIGRNYAKILFFDIINKLTTLFICPRTGGRKIEHILFILLVVLPLVAYTFLYLVKILPQPFSGTDILDYAISGRMLFDEKSLAPIWVMDFTKSGYVYKVSSAPSFSLLLTWEQMINSLFHVKSDLYFRSIGVYYGWLVVALSFYWVAKQNKWLAVICSFALLSGLGFYLTLLLPHIDTYRIFFSSMTLVFLAYSVKKTDFFSISLFGVFCGFAAFSHRIGLVIAAINCIVFFVMLESNFKTRVSSSTVVIFFILVFGGGHYIIDLMLGQGLWLSSK